MSGTPQILTATNNRIGPAHGPRENTMANAFTLILPLVITFAVATWGPLSISAKDEPYPVRDNTRRPSPCKD